MGVKGPVPAPPPPVVLRLLEQNVTQNFLLKGGETRADCVVYIYLCCMLVLGRFFPCMVPHLHGVICEVVQCHYCFSAQTDFNMLLLRLSLGWLHV